MGKKNKKKKVKAAPKKVEQTTPGIGRPNYAKIGMEYRKNESKILLEKVRKLGYLKKPPKEEDEDT